MHNVPTAAPQRCEQHTLLGGTAEFLNLFLTRKKPASSKVPAREEFSAFFGKGGQHLDVTDDHGLPPAAHDTLLFPLAKQATHGKERGAR